MLDSLTFTNPRCIELSKYSFPNIGCPPSYTMLDNLTRMAWLSGPDKRPIYFNKVWLAYTALSRMQTLTNGWARSLHPVDYPAFWKRYLTAFNAREPFSMKYRLRSADGEYRWYRDEATPLIDDSNNFLGFLGLCMEINEQERAEWALLYEHERAQVMLNVIGDAVVSIDAIGNIDYLNATSEKWMGVETKKYIGQSLIQILGVFDPNTRDFVNEKVSLCLKSGHESEIQSFPILLSVNEIDHRMEFSVSAICDKERRITGAILVFKDLSELRRLSKELPRGQ